MTWKSHYVPTEKNLWQGRADSPRDSCFFQIVQMFDLSQLKTVPDNTRKFALVGFCCDEGIRRNQGRTGAAQGPHAIRTLLAKLPVPHNITFYDAGNIICENGDLEGAQQVLGEAVSLLLQKNITPLVVGGGHEVAFGHYQGLEKNIVTTHPQKNLGIVNFDAHFDMRPTLPHNQGSSGTPFLQIAHAHEKANRRFDYSCIGIQKMGNTHCLFETAKKHNAHVLLAEEIHENGVNPAREFAHRIVQENDLIYTSLCLDVFSSAYAPGVSAPQPLGLTPWQVLPLLRQLASSGKVMSYDIAELSPQYDTDQHTAKLAVNFIYEIVSHHKNLIR